MRHSIGSICILALALLLSGCVVEAQQLTSPNPELLPSPIPEPVRGTMEDTVQEIHINQLGYRPRDTKIVKAPGGYSVFYVMDRDTEQVVFEGTFGNAKEDQGAGEDVVCGDFSSLDSPGQYVVQVPELGRSYPFSIAEDIYAELNTAVLKMLYYQRCGVTLTEQYAGAWSHPACHTCRGKIYGAKGTSFKGSGGWHDTGDFSKSAVPAARTVTDLLLAYSLYPEAFGDDTHIPESGNGTPDILDEARVGLEWLLKMQDPRTGGVYHTYITEESPSMETMPQQDTAAYYVVSISPTATGDFCAVMAQAARIYKKIDGEFAQKCLEAAGEAYGWMRANPDTSAYRHPGDITAGDYWNESHRDEYYWASMEMYVTTGEQVYLDDADPYGDKTALFWSDTLDLYNVSLLGVFSYLLSDEADSHSVLYQGMAENVLQAADEITGWASKNGYGIDMGPKDYIWGSNLIVSNRAVVLLVANHLSPKDAYVQTARAHFDYLLGCNTLNQCYVTGFGAKPVLRPNHRPSVADTNILPVPGMVVGGPNANRQDPIAQSELKQETPPAKCYLDQTWAYSLNGVATYWNSPMVLLCAYFNGDKE